MNEALERACIAAHWDRWGGAGTIDPVSAWQVLPADAKESWRSQISAAIAALREPSEAVIAAGHNNGRWGTILEVWQAMIDEILKD